MLPFGDHLFFTFLRSLFSGEIDWLYDGISSLLIGLNGI
jgi:hypothetical protein